MFPSTSWDEVGCIAPARVANRRGSSSFLTWVPWRVPLGAVRALRTRSRTVASWHVLDSVGPGVLPFIRSHVGDEGYRLGAGVTKRARVPARTRRRYRRRWGMVGPTHRGHRRTFTREEEAELTSSCSTDVRGERGENERRRGSRRGSDEQFWADFEEMESDAASERTEEHQRGPVEDLSARYRPVGEPFEQ